MVHTLPTKARVAKKLSITMKRLYILLVALCSTLTVGAQEYSLPAIDARSLGMGGVEMTSVAGVHTLYSNAAMTAFSAFPAKISTSYYGQADFDYYGVSGYLRCGGSHVVQAGWRQYLRKKGNNDSALDLGYTYRIGEDWAVGLVGRYMHLKRYEESADALAVDLAVAWQHGVETLGEFSWIRVGAKLTNLGGFLSNTPYDLPINLKVGAALDSYLSDAHQITVGLDLGYCFTPSAVRGFEAALGAEYTLMQLIRLRAGYHLGESKSYTPSFGSIGAGISLLHMRVDFAYLLAEKGSFLRNTYSISFGLDF